MPERIPTATLTQIDTETLEIDDTYPGTFGFSAHLSRDPGPDWATEFAILYEGASYPGKPPVIVDGGRLRVFYLPRYADDLPRFLQFLKGVVHDTNQSVEARNRILPDEEKEKAEFRERLAAAAKEFSSS